MRILKYRLIRSLGKHSCIPAETVTFCPISCKNLPERHAGNLFRRESERRSVWQTFHGCSARKVSARGETEFHSQQGTCSESDCFTWIKESGTENSWFRRNGSIMRSDIQIRWIRWMDFSITSTGIMPETSGQPGECSGRHADLFRL